MAKKEIDKRIKKHLTKKGEEKYQFSLYLGVDPLTGKKRKTTRRGFSTPLAAERALKRLEAYTGKRTASFYSSKEQEIRICLRLMV
ncbi:TPA: Arm DNA-binding domain-containing protein [Enterococcus faecium]